MIRSWKKSDFYVWYSTELSELLEPEELQVIFFRLLKHNGISQLDWAMIDELEVDELIWKGYVEDLKKERPIQYILGYEYFLEEQFMVNEHVLIPRPETEELVKWAISESDRNKEARLLELGTGSGCIAISLKKALPLAFITATDLSEGALEVAKHNAKRLNVSIEFIKDDMLNSDIQGMDYDVMVSNPPYIPIEEAATMDRRVKDYEPKMALFTKKENPLQFYHALIQLAIEKLAQNGKLYVEVHENYALEVFDLAKKNALIPEIRKDFYGRQRMLRIIKPTFKD